MEKESFYAMLALVDSLRGPADARTARLACELLSGHLRATIPT